MKSNGIDSSAKPERKHLKVELLDLMNRRRHYWLSYVEAICLSGTHDGFSRALGTF
jgi:hypothetical protein